MVTIPVVLQSYRDDKSKLVLRPILTQAFIGLYDGIPIKEINIFLKRDEARVFKYLKDFEDAKLITRVPRLVKLPYKSKTKGRLSKKEKVIFLTQKGKLLQYHLKKIVELLET